MTGIFLFGLCCHDKMLSNTPANMVKELWICHNKWVKHQQPWKDLNVWAMTSTDDCNLTTIGSCFETSKCFQNLHSSHSMVYSTTPPNLVLPGYRFKQNYQNHTYCTWMYIWYLWTSTFFPPQFWSQKSGVHFFPQRDNNTTCRFQLPPDVEGFFEAHHHPIPNVWFGDLSRLLHALQTHQASQLLQQRLQPLERFAHAKKSQFWRSFTEGPLGCSWFLLLVPCLVGVFGMFVERTKQSRALLVLSNLLGWRCETNFD